jgi:hypothetical protein
MHGPELVPDLLYLVRDSWRWGKAHEAPGIHHASRRRGGVNSLAVRGARAASGKVYRVGCAYYAGLATFGPYHEAFISALHDLGYVAGQNIVYDIRSAESDPIRLPDIVDELISLKPDVLAGNEPVDVVRLGAGVGAFVGTRSRRTANSCRAWGRAARSQGRRQRRPMIRGRGGPCTHRRRRPISPGS